MGTATQELTPVHELIAAAEHEERAKSQLAIARQKAAEYLRDSGYEAGKVKDLDLPEGIAVTLKAVKPKDISPSEEMEDLLTQLNSARDYLAQSNAIEVNRLMEETRRIRGELAIAQKRLDRLNQEIIGLGEDEGTKAIARRLKAATEKHLLDNASCTVACSLPDTVHVPFLEKGT